jgi:predicted nucleotidyltransferase component of viral defense system
MPFNDAYRRQVTLLIKIMPHVAREDCFALKGGTAINLFVRDMPRLSVDIDLTYLPVSPRTDSLAAIDAAMKRIAERIRKALRGAQISMSETVPGEAVTKLLVRHDNAQVKIEVTPVLRGCVFEPEVRRVSASVEAAFGFAEVRVVSFADLYAGKIVAALDRQHPRDLFDVRDLLANEGVNDSLRRAVVVYLLSHNRPMAEILAPRRKSMSGEFLRGFEGMTAVPVSIEDLTTARETLIGTIVGEMPEPHRRFLISFKRGEPDWPLLDVDGASDLPAVRWRQHNLDTLGKEEREKLASQLERVLRNDAPMGSEEG